MDNVLNIDWSMLGFDQELTRSEAKLWLRRLRRLVRLVSSLFVKMHRRLLGNGIELLSSRDVRLTCRIVSITVEILVWPRRIILGIRVSSYPHLLRKVFFW